MAVEGWVELLSLLPSFELVLSFFFFLFKKETKLHLASRHSIVTLSTA